MLSKLAEAKIVVEVTEDAVEVAEEELPTIQTIKQIANLKKVINLKTQIHQDGQHQDMQIRVGMIRLCGLAEGRKRHGGFL